MTGGKKLLALVLMGCVAVWGLIACEQAAKSPQDSGLESISPPKPVAPAPAKTEAAATTPAAEASDGAAPADVTP